MKPLYLGIKGFGPFLNLEISENNFKVLTENKLFLISGEIGAGKTTIFDAILYALYGEGTIEGRTPTDLISHYIKNRPGIYPEIDFKFFLDGKTYRIIRRPPFKGRSENVNLWIENILFSSKKTEIKNKIKELLGLEVKQFKKVFLIPQGEYRKILLADEKERKALLETIFETFQFSQIEEFFKNSLKELKNEYQSLKDREIELQKLGQIQNMEELKQKIEKIKEKIEQSTNIEKNLIFKRKKLEEQIQIYEILNQNYQKLEDLSQKLENFKLQQKEIEEKQKFLNILKIIKDHLTYYENLTNLWKILREFHIKRKKLSVELKKISDILDSLNKNLEKLIQNKENIENKKRELQKLKNIQQQINQKNELEKKLSQINEVLTNRVKSWENQTQKIENLKNRLERLLEEKEELYKISQLLKEKEEIEKSIKNLNKYETLIKQRQQLQTTLDNLQHEINKIEKLKNDLELKHQAICLVKSLKEGEPCPVCGSLYHPDPVKFDENIDRKIIKLNDLWLKNRKNFELVQKQFFQIEAQIKHLETEIFYSKSKKEELILKLEKLNKEIYKSAFLEKIKQEKDINTVYDEEIKKLKQLLNSLEIQEKKEKEAIESLEKEKAKLNGQIELLKDLGYDSDEKKIQRSIEKISKEIVEWETTKNKIEDQLQKNTQTKTKIATEIHNLNEFISQRLLEYKFNLFKLSQLKKNKIISSLKDFKHYIPLLSKIPEIEKEIQNFYQEFKRTQQNLEEIKAEIEKYSLNGLDYKKISSDLEKLKNQKTEIEKSLGNLHQQIGSWKTKLNQLENIWDALKDIQAKEKKLENEIPLLEKIYNLIIGKNNKKISFHSFVLSLYVKYILYRANYYFKEFSFGRYKFVENKFFHKKLNLEIFDHYTGSIREAKTLSGGESFLATLSLALGTSDVILYLFRKKPFESLFIDEGFGTLDENTLEKVVNILLNLAHQSGRIIGIISHLKDLKEKFPVILEVYKSQTSGSHIKIIKKF